MGKSNSSRNQECNFSSSPKKAPGPDGILFLILQKSYHAISDLFDMVFSELIKNGYHPQC